MPGRSRGEFPPDSRLAGSIGPTEPTGPTGPTGGFGRDSGRLDPPQTPAGDIVLDFEQADLRDVVRVILGDQYTTVVNWTFRSIAANDILVEGDFLILNPQPNYVDGVSSGRPQWLLRPRDLIPVQFALSTTKPGLYVPNRAIALVGGSEVVYVVEDGVATVRPVSVHESFEELRRIDGEGITAGANVVVGGVHYVSDGQPVTVTEVL